VEGQKSFQDRILHPFPRHDLRGGGILIFPFFAFGERDKCACLAYLVKPTLGYREIKTQRPLDGNTAVAEILISKYAYTLSRREIPV
jgi:hypothetical protein